MKIPGFKRLDKQNFSPEYRDLIDKLSFTVNNDIEVLYNVLNRNSSLKDNIHCTVKDVEVIVDSNGIPKNTASFQLDIANMRIMGCSVLRAINEDNSSIFPTSAPFVSFSQSSNIINLNHITGLQADQTYTLTIVAWGL